MPAIQPTSCVDMYKLLSPRCRCVIRSFSAIGALRPCPYASLLPLLCSTITTALPCRRQDTGVKSELPDGINPAWQVTG
jgi:hypothetical protein